MMVTSWTEVNDLNTARTQIVGAGTQTSALAFGGTTPGNRLQQNLGMELVGQK
jgi:hypothetical protein